MPVSLAPGYEGIVQHGLHLPPDSPRWMVRFQESRAYAKAGPPVEPSRCESRRRGTVTMDNRLYGRYSGEIQLIREDLPPTKRST